MTSSNSNSGSMPSSLKGKHKVQNKEKHIYLIIMWLNVNYTKLYSSNMAVGGFSMLMDCGVPYSWVLQMLSTLHFHCFRTYGCCKLVVWLWMCAESEILLVYFEQEAKNIFSRQYPDKQCNTSWKCFCFVSIHWLHISRFVLHGIKVLKMRKMLLSWTYHIQYKNTPFNSCLFSNLDLFW